MSTPTRFVQRALAALSILAACGLAPVRADSAPDDQVQRGEYLAIAGDCAACHTAPGRAPFAGGLAIATPIGAVVATNITPSKTAGIGAYTQQQFADALRRGLRADGAHLYPAMPYTAYALVDDDDLAALYAYFMRAVRPIDVKPAATPLPFPFNLRASMAVWNTLFLDTRPFTTDPAQSAPWNRGAYLVRGLTHCSTCHTPRNALMAEQSSHELAGASLGNWFASNITSDPVSGIGGWSDAELVAYLRSGRAAGKAQAAGPMAEAIDHSLQHLSEADLQAIVAYLRSVPARRDAADTEPVQARGQAGDQLASLRGVPLPDDPQAMSGAQLYDAYCATCHQAQGQGSFDGGMPSLFHNTATGRAQPGNLVMVILEGIQRGVEHADVLMPGFADELSDHQVATLASWLGRQYGNPANAVDAHAVAQLRSGGTPSRLLLATRVGLVLVGVVVLALIVRWARRRGRRAGER